MRSNPQSVLAQDNDENEVNLTPMLDVVFIMLIFFIVTASFVRESGLDVNQPESTRTPDRSDDSNILIAISPDDEILIDSRSVDPRAVRANVERLRAENPDGALVIQASRRSTNKRLVQVMDAARQAGVFNISMADSTP